RDRGRGSGGTLAHARRPLVCYQIPVVPIRPWPRPPPARRRAALQRPKRTADSRMSSKPDAHDPLSPCEPCSSAAERNADAATGREEDAWHFKPAGLERPLHSGLRYEPGSFGDILKGAWAIEVARWLLASSQPLSCLDPFAGCETYAATDGTRGRAAKLGRG